MKLVKDFTSGNIAGQLARFTLPLYLSNLLQIVYQIVDMIIVGQVLGKIGLAAVSIGGDAAHFMAFVAMGFGNASQVLISQLLGQRNLERLGKFIANMLSFMFVAAIFLTIFCLSIQRKFLEIMNTPAEAFQGALDYSLVSMSGIIFMYGFNMTGAILRGLGDSKHPFIFVSVSAILNLILDLIFILELDLGVFGAALATIISQAVSCILCIIFLYRNREHLGFEIHSRDFFHWDRSLLGSLIGLGIPMAIKGAAIQTSKLFVNSWLNSFGVAVAAFAGIANKIGMMANLLSNSMNTAGASMVGQNLGAQKFDRAMKIVKIIALVTFAIASILSIIWWIFTREIVGFFTEDLEVIAIGLEYLPIGILIFYGSAARCPMNALINGSGDTRMNFLTALFDGIILRIGLALLFGLFFEMGYFGFWLGDAVAGFTPLWLGLIFIASGRWKRRLEI
ncbi:MAG: MATE family efflux transporter [Selenomonadaceae bacterium]|nr:MATE family efflux transporter [Selenomonadaceae bacterium]